MFYAIANPFNIVYFLYAFKDKGPVYLPSRCKIGELFYPGDQSDDWVCDCTPGNIQCFQFFFSYY